MPYVKTSQEHRCVPVRGMQTPAMLRIPSALRAVGLAALLSACSSPTSQRPDSGATTPRPPAPVEEHPTSGDTRTRVLPPGGVALAPPKPVRTLEALRRQAAERLVAANPRQTYMGRVPDILLAIPVLEVELNSDGSVRRIEVVRYPRQARDTTQLAMDAVHRAAPFGDVSRMPKPWKFTETFLFDDARHFKPRSLD